MMVSHLLLFLAALTGAASNLVLKKHVLIRTPMTWSKARDYCRQNYVDLSIIDTLDEYNRFTNQTAEFASVRSWIGLSKNSSEIKYTKWCDGTVLNFTHWESGSLIYGFNQHCITSQNNAWNYYFCDYLMPFYCYSEVIVVEEKKTWDEASQHCRMYYTDLISVSTQTNLLVVNNLKLNFTVSSFWIGLRYLDGSWVLVNKESLGSQDSLPLCPNQSFSCGSRNVVTNIWENRDCRKKMYFICYRQVRG